MKPEGANVELLENVNAGMPYMVPSVAMQFRLLRKLVLDQSGVDFLAVCADVMRSPDYNSTKVGVANRSWHKTGRAFDADQTNPLLVVVKEPKAGQTFFRMYLRSNLGRMMQVQGIRGNPVRAKLFDFTTAAESLGWQRIPAWKGWSISGSGYNKMEFWHYQITDGLTWSQAMLMCYAPMPIPIPEVIATFDSILGKNDRGANVKKLQQKLAELGHLPLEEVDGVFGAKTDTAVRLFQKEKGLTVDGLVGKATQEALFLA